MTGRTHDLAAFTALSYVVATQPLQQVTLATGIVSIMATLVGGLTPDIDQPTADLWRKFPAGSVIGRILYPLWFSAFQVSTNENRGSYRKNNSFSWTAFLYRLYLLSQLHKIC